jgi:hypothetical protein
MDDLLFASIDLRPIDKEKAVREIIDVPDSDWYWSEYYGTNILPMMSKNGHDITNYREGEFNWTSHASPTIRDWFENEVFPWMGEKTRVLVMKTQPGIANNEHVDCREEELGTRQHKFRQVIQGRTGTLYFKTATGDVAVPDIDGPFLMDGTWPHGMKNDSSEIKLTVIAGSPWTGRDSYENIRMLMNKSQFQFPPDYQKYFQTHGPR